MHIGSKEGTRKQIELYLASVFAIIKLGLHSSQKCRRVRDGRQALGCELGG